MPQLSQHPGSDFHVSQDARRDWQLRQQLQPPSETWAVYFGSALALHDGTLVVGSAPQQRQGDGPWSMLMEPPKGRNGGQGRDPKLHSEQGFRLRH